MYKIAPPISSEVELANWFKLNGDKNKSISISNLYKGLHSHKQVCPSIMNSQI